MFKKLKSNRGEIVLGALAVGVVVGMFFTFVLHLNK